jgi:hypothetical protein
VLVAALLTVLGWGGERETVALTSLRVGDDRSTLPGP